MSTETVVATIRENVATGSALRICGRSTWLDAGRPVRASNSLTLRDDTGVVSYVPGDLVLTVRAGTSLGQVDDITRAHDQWLPLDPFGSPEGSIGATIATASAGPLSTTFGLARDLVLGLEFVTGNGDVVRSGGKVVKNVAGFDLSRLVTGSWGTLGVITEVTLRLYARPKVDRTFTLALPRDAREMSLLLRAIHVSPLAPFAFELLNGAAARALQLGVHPICLIRLGGNAPVVEAQIRSFSQLAPATEVPVEVWQRLRQLEQHAESVIRVSNLPSRFFATASAILGDAPPGVFTYVSPRRGVLRIVTLPQTADAEPASEPTISRSFDLPSRDEHFDSVVVFEKLPAEVWPIVAPSVVANPLSRGIKKAYDPHRILNPGILGD
ncbi:MAG: FAD-binding oxidoreductase [Gemmatimonadaceae bacterium]